MKVLYMLSYEDVRTVCCYDNFYTAGTNDEYEKMFSMIKGCAIPFGEVVEITKNIAAHSSEDVTVELATERLLNAASIIVR